MRSGRYFTGSWGNTTIRNTNAYERLGSHLSNARGARWISFDAIRDDGVRGGPPVHYTCRRSFWRRCGTGHSGSDWTASDRTGCGTPTSRSPMPKALR